MWEIYNYNFCFRGVGFNDVNHEIVKKYSQDKNDPDPDLPALTNWELFKSCDNYLPLKHGNIFKGSSETVLKSLKSDAASAYPLISEQFYYLLCYFLELKLNHGSAIEKSIYSGMNACDLIDRLLTKRCVSYFGRNENYLMVSGARAMGDFSKVGTDEETAPLVMSDCLTRDEIKLSGFILISSKVTKVVKDKSYSSISIGIPFPIINREELFDWEDIIVSKRQNIPEKGYGTKPEDVLEDSPLHQKMLLKSMWGSFYGRKKMIPFTALDKRKGQKRFQRLIGRVDDIGEYWRLPHKNYLDTRNLAVRLSVITLGIFAEANKRAHDEKKMAYIVIDKNKIGLGDHCPAIYETIFLRNLAYELLCMYRYLNSVHGILFVEFKEHPESLKDGSKMYLSDGVFGNQHPNEGIEIKYSTREEWKKDMSSVSEQFLIVETYRLDANAMPGNELWVNKVSKEYSHPSYDVRNTAIPFIHNAHVNGTRINGRNVRSYGWYGVGSWKNIHLVMY